MGGRAGRKDHALGRDTQLTESLLEGRDGEPQKDTSSIFRLLGLAKEEACVSLCPVSRLRTSDTSIESRHAHSCEVIPVDTPMKPVSVPA